MSRRDEMLLEGLEELAVETGLGSMPAPDWEDVLARSRLGSNGFDATQARRVVLREWRGARGPAGRIRRSVVLVVLIGLLLITVFATPLGGAIYDRFESWLGTAPGELAPKAEQDAFRRVNGLAPFAFPPSTVLHEVSSTSVGGVAYRLLGFTADAGERFCLRLVVEGAATPIVFACSRRQTLERGPVVALEVGEYTVDVPGGAHRISFGFAADGIVNIEAELSDGSIKRTPVEHNTFLLITRREERLAALTGETARGRRFAVRFVAPAEVGQTESSAGVGGPTRTERVSGVGRIGWIDRRVNNGAAYPVGAQKPSWGIGEATWLRVVRPPAALSTEPIAIVVGTVEPTLLGVIGRLKGTQLCYALVNTAGVPGGGGCSPLDDGFRAGTPLVFSSSMETGSAQIETLIGLVDDDVASVRIYTADGAMLSLGLTHNMFAVQLGRASFPIRVVAHDVQGRVVYTKLNPGAG
jgi:hypothetical protein